VTPSQTQGSSSTFESQGNAQWWKLIRPNVFLTFVALVQHQASSRVDNITSVDHNNLMVEVKGRAVAGAAKCKKRNAATAAEPLRNLLDTKLVSLTAQYWLISMCIRTHSLVEKRFHGPEFAKHATLLALIALLLVQVTKAVAALFKDYKARTAAAGSTPLLEDGENITVSQSCLFEAVQLSHYWHTSSCCCLS
jgi:hypothetical protein